MSTNELTPGPQTVDSLTVQTISLESAQQSDVASPVEAGLLRRAAVAYGLGAIAVGMAAALVMDHFSGWSPSVWLRMPLVILFALIVYVGPAAGYLWHVHRVWSRARPPAFTIAGMPPGYLVASLPARFAYAVVAFAVAGTMLADGAVVRDDWVAGVRSMLPYLLLAALLMLRSAQAEVLPLGLRVRRLGLSWFVPWAKIRGPLVIEANRELRVPYARAAKRGERDSVLRIPVRQLDIEPELLAKVIKHYAETPEQRTAIGTEQELNRLRAAFATGN